jgi:hypothetical protein
MDEFEQAASRAVHNAIQNAANGTDRSAQAAEFRLGMSNIGHCQQAALFMIRQTPPTDERDKTAAFFGTVAGAAIEKQLKIDHPGWIFQDEAVFNIPSGGEIGCHPDIVIPASEGVTKEEFMAQFEEGYEGPELYVQGVWDLKSKDKLDYIKKYGPDRQQIFQVSGYASAMIDAGVLDPDQPIWISDVYYDRSGKEKDPYTFGWWYDPKVLNEIDDWIHDLKYAAVTGADALKEKSRDWCWSYCEWATACRGLDTDVEGLIEDPGHLTAVELYNQGAELVREGEKMKTSAKLELPTSLSGSTGTHNVRWTWINPTKIAESTRAGYWKLDIRKVPKPKTPKTRAPRKKKEPANA